MRDPDIVVAINHTALCPWGALVEGGDEGAVGRELADRTVAEGCVVNVPETIDAQPVTGVAITTPVDSVCSIERFAGVPAEHRIRRPDDAVTVDETAVTAKADGVFLSFDRAGDAVQQVKPLAARAAHPDVVVGVDGNVTSTKRVDSCVVQNALILSS